MELIPNQPGATVLPVKDFDALKDAVALNDGIKNEKDKSAVTQILTHRTSSQRQEIMKAYKNKFDKDLIKDLKEALSGVYEKLIVALMKPREAFLADELRRAIKGMGTDKDTITEILCSRWPQDVKAIAEAYYERHEKALNVVLTCEKAVVGDYLDLLVQGLIMGIRTSNNATGAVSIDLAKKNAKQLYDAGEGTWGTDEAVFMKILVNESWDQLRQIFEEYKKLSGKTIEQAVKAEFSGDMKTAILTMVKCAVNRPRYYAERLEGAMKGLGTDDETLIRIIITRSEIDLKEVKKEYEKLYEKTLHDAVKKETSGEYQKALVSLLGDL